MQRHWYVMIFVFYAEEEFIEIINENVDIETLQETCPPCINGHCIPPGVCACDSGWTGDNCTTGKVDRYIIPRSLLVCFSCITI